MENINVPNLVKTNQYFQSMSLIKNYEDTLQKLFSSSKDSNITKEPYAFIWKLEKGEDSLFPQMKDLDLSDFGLEIDKLKNVVVTGPYVRNCIVDTINDKNVRRELYMYRFGEEKWEDLIDISEFSNKKTEYIYQIDDGDITRKIFLVKKKYRSPSHILLQHGYLKRIGWLNDNFYVSSMFLIEIQKHINLMKINFKDPILNLPYDPLEIYQTYEKDKSHPVKIIDMIDYDALTSIQSKNFNKLFNSKTCIELCMDKYLKEDHPILLNELKRMILYLSGFKYMRPPFIYARMLEFDKKYPDIYNLLTSISNNYGITNVSTIPSSFEEINDKILELIVSKDSVTDFIEYLTFSKQKIGKVIIGHVIKYNSANISRAIISNNLIDNYLIYYLILMTENFELTKTLNPEFNMEIAVNYLRDILENGKVKSLYFLYDFDRSILNTTFEQNKNILHCVGTIGEFNDMIELIMKLHPTLIDTMDSNKETPVIYHSKYNPEILNALLCYDFDPTLVDNENNTFLHHLCKHDRIDILKNSLEKYPELIDMPNKKSETPAIICCQNAKEDMFYVIKGKGCDLKTRDYYGNSCYHYICSNSLCIGMVIENTQNSFGIRPYNYCKISPKYYNFTDEE